MGEGDENVFGTRGNPQVTICSIKGIEQYLDAARQIQVDLTCGYPYHLTTPNGGIQDSPFISAGANACLKIYLKKMGADDSETLHGFRSTCAITLALMVADVSEIIHHVGWANHQTALYCMQLTKVLNLCGAFAKLALSEVLNIPNAWQNINELQHFVCAFPTDNPHKRLLSQ